MATIQEEENDNMDRQGSPMSTIPEEPEPEDIFHMDQASNLADVADVSDFMAVKSGDTFDKDELASALAGAKGIEEDLLQAEIEKAVAAELEEAAQTHQVKEDKTETDISPVVSSSAVPEKSQAVPPSTFMTIQITPPTKKGAKPPSPLAQSTASKAKPSSARKGKFDNKNN